MTSSVFICAASTLSTVPRPTGPFGRVSCLRRHSSPGIVAGAHCRPELVQLAWILPRLLQGLDVHGDYSKSRAFISWQPDSVCKRHSSAHKRSGLSFKLAARAGGDDYSG